MLRETGNDHGTHRDHGDDVIITGDGDDSVFGNDGNDLICTRGGADVVDGGLGDDHINLGTVPCGPEQAGHGNDGSDVVYGSANCKTGTFELLSGDAGDDQLFGKGGPDKMAGNDGSDKMYGAGGNDILNGQNDPGGGPDLLSGGKGKDTCNADPNDTLKGCEGP